MQAQVARHVDGVGKVDRGGTGSVLDRGCTVPEVYWMFAVQHQAGTSRRRGIFAKKNIAPSSVGGNSSPLHDSQSVDELASLDRYYHFHGHSGLCA